MNQFSFSHKNLPVSKYDSISLCEALACSLWKLTGADLCLVEVFEPFSKSSVLFCCHSAPPLYSSGLPFPSFRIREWTQSSCEFTWTERKHSVPFTEGLLSTKAHVVPGEWRFLYERVGMESVLTYPLINSSNPDELFWGSVTLAHRNSSFFTSNDVVYHNLTVLLNEFSSFAPIQLMRDTASLVYGLKSSPSLKHQAQILQQFLTRHTPAISASIAVFDKAYHSAAFFVDPTETNQQQTQKYWQQELRKEAFQLGENTAVWNTHLCGDSEGMPVNMESQFSFQHTDLDLLHKNKFQTTKSLWILPMRQNPHERYTVNRSQTGQGPPVLGLSVKINGQGTSRWTGYLGALYFQTTSNADFSKSDKISMVSLIKRLYTVFEKTFKRSEVCPVAGAVANRPAPQSVAIPSRTAGATLSLPKDFMDQLKLATETNRKRAQTHDEDLQKLKIHSLIDKDSANSIVLQGRYGNRNSAIKVIPGGQNREQNFKIRLEQSILSSVDHPNIVRLLGSMVEVPGSKVLNTCCCEINSKQVETWLYAKWPRLSSARALNWNLLVMEHCDGGSLEYMIHSRKIFDRSQVSYKRDLLLTLLDISKGMEYLHKLEIVHGDLKPANILIKKSESDPRHWMCCIADFGSSLRKDYISPASFTTHGCTKAYRAPEIMSSIDCAKRCKLHERYSADVYSFGMIIYEMIEGCVPFQGETGISIENKVRERKRPPVRSMHCPIEARQLLDECWAQEADRRPTFHEISEKVKQLLGQFVGCH